MNFPSRETVERLRREYPAGTRVELVCMDDCQAPPAGTLDCLAIGTVSEPKRAISSFKRPAALSIREALSEFEHTSSQNKSDLCASLFLIGFIS